MAYLPFRDHTTKPPVQNSQFLLWLLEKGIWYSRVGKLHRLELNNRNMNFMKDLPHMVNISLTRGKKTLPANILLFSRARIEMVIEAENLQLEASKLPNLFCLLYLPIPFLTTIVALSNILSLPFFSRNLRKGMGICKDKRKGSSCSWLLPPSKR